jgi:L-seryl-tRNA(Ser) seleniumtransferase
LAAKLGSGFTVEVVACMSQIGSGALPLEDLPSAGLAIRPRATRGSGRALKRLAYGFRRLPVPVIGRIEDGAQILDLRCLEDEAAFATNLAALDLGDDDGAA